MRLCWPVAIFQPPHADTDTGLQIMMYEKYEHHALQSTLWRFNGPAVIQRLVIYVIIPYTHTPPALRLDWLVPAFVCVNKKIWKKYTTLNNTTDYSSALLPSGIIDVAPIFQTFTRSFCILYKYKKGRGHYRTFLSTRIIKNHSSLMFK